jgi:hypothetical protein
MSKEVVVENSIGVVLGLVGGWFNKYFLGLKISFILSYFPELHELVPNCIVAACCAATGFVVTKVCHTIYRKIIKWLNY